MNSVERLAFHRILPAKKETQRAATTTSALGTSEVQWDGSYRPIPALHLHYIFSIRNVGTCTSYGLNNPFSLRFAWHAGWAVTVGDVLCGIRDMAIPTERSFTPDLDRREVVSDRACGCCCVGRADQRGCDGGASGLVACCGWGRLGVVGGQAFFITCGGTI